MRKQTNKFNFNVPGTKLLSRFGQSNAATRQQARQAGKVCGKPMPQRMLKYHTKRLQKKCTHPRLKAVSWGASEAIEYCNDCGYARGVVY